MNAQAQENAAKFLDGKIAANDIGGIYCFCGDEEYMLDYYIKKIYGEVASKGSPEFDCASFDEDNFDVGEFADAVMSYPVASEFKLVVVKHIELGKLDNAVKGEIADCLTDMGSGVCVIFKSNEFGGANTKAAPKKTAAAKTSKKSKSKSGSDNIEIVAYLKENGILCEFKENTKQSLVRWIKKIVASENADISDANASYIINRAGTMMYPLRNELDKLIAYVKAENRREILEGDIELLVADMSESAIGAFELSNALTAKDYAKAVEVLAKHEYQKDEPVLLLGQIARCFCDMSAVSLAMTGGISDRVTIAKKTGMHEYKVKLLADCVRSCKNPARYIAAALELCRICDIRLKSTAIPSYQLLENLLYSLSEIGK